MKIETPVFVIIASALSWGFLTVWARIILLEYELAPATFTFIQMLSGGLVLTLLSHKRIRKIGVMPLKQIYTWAFGLFRVLSASFYVGALVYITAANVAFLGAVTVTMSVLFVWLTLKRKPKLLEIPAHIAIIFAAYYMVLQLDGQFNNPAVWLLLVSQILITVAITLGEIHPLNQNNNSGDTLYLTGMVLLASAFILLVFSYIASQIEQQLPRDFYPEIRLHIVKFILQDIFNPHAWLFGFITGVTFRTAAIYYSLRAVKLTSSEFYLGAMALMPLIYLPLEYIAARYGYLPVAILDAKQILFGTIMLISSLYIIYLKRK